MAEKNSGLYVLSLRDVRISSTSGHCIPIKSQVPKRIPESLRYEAYSLGCVECNENGKIAGSEDFATEQPEEKLSLVDVLTQIYVDGEVENLDAQGIPKADFVNELLGNPKPRVNKEKIIRAWLRVSADQGVLEEEGLA